ncbi:hypothetical protein ALI22I_20820 [Saccharothrix sp. ALI-22-I]|uniref:hypothetical protein n=1 Tax=Saccharothrix sp. ALI-22-I TaxID=1933778 RepID=UPI00097C7345|nr:hypothetical protein [Saccharothrix sp. ALI-22-I]ONI87661.1 hypothetical protein ALI22I_20820 [Saccharothrix sp. ALI-22-I]
MTEGQPKDDIRPIPLPRGVPLVGNTLQIPSGSPVRFFAELGRRYPDGIYSLSIAGAEEVFV